MSISRQHKTLVRQTFAIVAQDAEGFAELFYNQLFSIDPSLRSLFTGDMREQGKKLTMMLSVAVASLDRLNALVPQIENLGQRHVRYGVKLAHYAIVGQALLMTLEAVLGERYTPEVHEAWLTIYTVLADTATAKAYPISVFANDAESKARRRKSRPLPSLEVLRATFNVI